MAAVWWTCDKEYLHECRNILSELKYNVTVGNRHLTQSVLAVADSYAILNRPEKVAPRLGVLIEHHLTRPPSCPTCHKPMRFESAKADKQYRKLRHVIFVCDCGRKSDQLVAV